MCNKNNGEEKRRRKAEQLQMLSSGQNAEECDATDDEFCTGAGFIKQKYVSKTEVDLDVKK